MDSNLESRARRQFLAKVFGTSALVTLAPGVMLVNLDTADGANLPVTRARRWGLLIDSAKCAVDCDACVRGCNQEHGLTSQHGPTTDAQWIRKVDLRDRRTGKVSSLPLMCQHCEHPPCVYVCPTGASFRRADGIVLVDKHTCIGCRYCVMACPYEARSFIHESLSDQKSYAPRGKGTVESCTLCVHRVDNQEQPIPACTESCNAAGHSAIVFGDLHDDSSVITQALAQHPSEQLRANLDLDTGVRYRNI